MYMSQDDDVTRGSGTVMLPRDPNLKLSGDYPVVTDPDDANKDCSVKEAVYRNAEDACYDSNGDPMTGLGRSCGMGTTKRILDMDASVGFVAAQGTGTCDIIQDDEGVCEVPCPRDCEGGTWSTGACIRMNEDGEEVALFDGGKLSEGTCGPGQRTKIRRPTGDFKPAVGTGSCTFSKQEPCFKTCTDDHGQPIDAQFVGVCGYSGIETEDRDIGSTVFGHEGCVKINEDGEPVKDEDDNYIAVGEGEEGRMRVYQPVVYGDSTKCKDRVKWKQCRGPDVPTDCVGGWKNQGTCENDTRNIIPDDEDEAGLTCDPKWSACYLRMNPLTGLTPTHGPTYRKKEYHISQPASEALPGGGRAGKACTGTVELEGGAKEERQFDPDDDKVFEQQCPRAQWVPECHKTEWVLDTSEGANTGYCVLDENGENPKKKYKRTVTGACGPEWETKSSRFFDEPYDPHDPDGNNEEKFVGCCYKTEWIDAGTLTEGNQPQTRTVKNCTNDSDPDDPDGTERTRDLKMCQVDDWEDKKPKKDNAGNIIGCRSDGLQPFTRNVYNAELCRADDVDTTNEMTEECCYNSSWRTTDTCGEDGFFVKRRDVLDGPANESGLCNDEDGTKAEEAPSDVSCCKKLQETEPVGECRSDGWQKYVYKSVGNCEGVDLTAPSKPCCYASEDQWGEWEAEVPGTMCEGDEELDVVRRRTVINEELCTGDDAKTEEKTKIQCANQHCTGKWEAVGYTFASVAGWEENFAVVEGRTESRCNRNRYGHCNPQNTYDIYERYGPSFKFVRQQDKGTFGKDCPAEDGHVHTEWERTDTGGYAICYPGRRCTTTGRNSCPPCPDANDKADLPDNLKAYNDAQAGRGGGGGGGGGGGEQRCPPGGC